MAVFTPLHINDIENLCETYALGKPVRLTPITQGVENTNYTLETNLRKYIITLIEYRTAHSALPFIIDLIKHYEKHTIPVPHIYNDTNDALHEKPVIISSFLNGVGADECDITADMAQQAGAMMARLHIAGENFDMERKNPMSLAQWFDLYDKTRSFMTTEQKQTIHTLLQDAQHILQDDLPHGAIHGDFFPDNVFFDPHKNICGVIDFYFACNDLYAYDLALAMNSWPFPNAFLKGYNGLRPLINNEHNALLLLRQCAALRIFLTRLHDWHFTPDHATITKKDPDEYWKTITKLQEK